LDTAPAPVDPRTLARVRRVWSHAMNDTLTWGRTVCGEHRHIEPVA